LGDGINHGTAYDENGNIKGMQQWGVKLNSSIQIDNLSYTYASTSNKLQAVTDAIAADQKLGDFTDKSTGSTDYSYDNNGNLTQDLNKESLHHRLIMRLIIELIIVVNPKLILIGYY